MSQHSVINRLYTGEGGVDFIGRRRIWYRVAIGIIVVAFLAAVLRGFNVGIDFEGGTKLNMPAAQLDKAVVAQQFQDATGVEPHSVEIVGQGDSRIVEITSQRLTDEQIDTARRQLFDEFKPLNARGEASPDAIGDSTVSESWGSTITERMLLAMAVFLALVFVFIAVRFEKLMAVAAIACIMMDAIVITGIYALVGFEVTPATIIGLLTVLAFSLYDTVVVFDKISELSSGFHGTCRRTYAELANTALNQTVMRSVSTTVISALPIIALMVVAVWLLGVGTLKDLAVVQLLGVIQGTLSSVFLAAPLLVTLKNGTRAVGEHNEAVASYRGEQADRGDDTADSDNPAAETTQPVAAKPVPAQRKAVGLQGSAQLPRQRRDDSADRGPALSWRPDQS